MNITNTMCSLLKKLLHAIIILLAEFLARVQEMQDICTRALMQVSAIFVFSGKFMAHYITNNGVLPAYGLRFYVNWSEIYFMYVYVHKVNTYVRAKLAQGAI